MYSVRHPARRYDREYIAYPISVFALCVAGSICRCGSVGKHGGFCFFSFPAVSMISCPHPPAPLPPPGKGESQSLFRRGLRPRHPCTEPPTALADAAMQEPGGGLARQVGGSTSIGGCPAGGLPGRSPARPTFSFISFPHPPAPLPVGKGAFSFHMQGASPLASPRPSRKRHGLHLRCGCPAGGLPSRSPARPVFSFISFPHPPAPLPVGKGAFSFLMQGASPLASPGAEPMVCCKPDRKQFPASGAARVQPQGICMAEATMPEAV